MNRNLVIGIGNRYRSDDGLGLEAAMRINRLNLPDTVVLESAGDLTSLTGEIEKCDSLIIIDSVLAGRPPGSIYKIDPFKGKITIPLDRKFSTHSSGIINDLRFLNAMTGLPEKTLIYGVEGADFSYGEGLSEPVVNALDSLVDLMAGDLQK